MPASRAVNEATAGARAASSVHSSQRSSTNPRHSINESPSKFGNFSWTPTDKQERSNRLMPAAKREPRWFTIADLVLIVAGVAFLMVSSSRMASGLIPLSLPFLVILSLSQLMFGVAEVLALVVLGPLRDMAARSGPPNGSSSASHRSLWPTRYPTSTRRSTRFIALRARTSLAWRCPLAAQRPRPWPPPWSRPHWRFSGSRLRERSHVARALSVAGITVGLCLWFWGPWRVAHLELPWLLIPSPAGEPSTWGWRGPLVFALRNIVANGLSVFTWGVLISAAVLAWRADRRAGSSRVWVWTELAAFQTAAVMALLFTAATVFDFDWAEPEQAPLRLAGLAAIGLASWWLTARLAARDLRVERDPGREERTSL